MNNPYKIVTYRLLSMDEYYSNEQLIISKIDTFITTFNKYYNKEFIHLDNLPSTCKDRVKDNTVIGFYNYNNLLVGLSTFNIGSPWYNPSLRVIEEIFSLSLYRGTGLINCLTYAMATIGKLNKCNVIVLANGSPLFGKLYSNTMNNKKWSSYNTYYKIIQ